MAGTVPIGPIRVSADGRHFTDPAGRPLFWLGDTQWELFRLFTAEAALPILRDRQAKGVDVVLVMLLGVDTHRSSPGGPAPYTNLAGELPWVDGDPLRPNEAYFRHVDTLIRLGERTGQTLVVGVYHQWQVDVITVDRARAWARWVAHRWRDVPNLIWSMYPKATADYVPVCRELAAGLRAGDGGAHLISVHPDPAVASSSFLHDEDWLDLNMIQTCMAFERIPEAVAADYARLPAKPVVMAEGAYEGVEFGRVQLALDIRRQAWWTQLSGGHHVYGHNDAWSCPHPVDRWLDAPGLKHLTVFRQVLTSLAGWWRLVPDPDLLASGRGSGLGQTVAARAADRTWILAYLGQAGPVAVCLDALAGAPARACWIDPASGDRIPAGPCPATGTWAVTAPADWEDAVLLVEAP